MKYNLTFTEAIDVLLEGGAVRGENFRPYFFLKIDKYERLVLVNANDMYRAEPYPYIRSLDKQKYRSLQVMTKKELEK